MGKNVRLWVAAAMVAAAVYGCEREEAVMNGFQFTATAEQVGTANGTKLHLAQEQYLAWEYDDEITVGSDKTQYATATDTAAKGWMHFTSGTAYATQTNGVFFTRLPDESDHFVGLHPYSRNNVVKGVSGSSNFAEVKIDLPATQGYSADTTFDRGVFPMVAYGTSSNYTLPFYALASVVRVQIFNEGAGASTVKSVAFTSADKQLKGLFNVLDYRTADPKLSSASSASADKTVTIDCGESGAAFNEGTLLTFYLVLPAYGESVTTTYDLTMTITNTSGQTCVKTLRANTRRHAIVYTPALSITAWGSAPTNQGISGNGTQARPFLVYTAADLQYLQQCYASAERKINGQPISENTYIRVKREGITLSGNASAWAGIPDFEGHIDNFVFGSADYDIKMQTEKPLFTSIKSTGHVSGLRIRYDANAYSGASFAPLCGINNGEITYCTVESGSAENGGLSYTTTGSNGIAGICVTNNGTLTGCICDAEFSNAGQKVAGICLSNTGTITACSAGEDMRVNTASSVVSGICDANSGTVRDCNSLAVAGTFDQWYGIARSNSGSVIHSYASWIGSIMASGAAAGIVGINAAGGVVNSCWCTTSIEGGTFVGGIVGQQTGGSVLNCYVDDPDGISLYLTSGGTAAGGLVGSQTSGTVANSYASINGLEVESGVGGTAVGALVGGTVNNCYAYEKEAYTGKFYGSNSSGTLTGCYLVARTQSGTTTVSVAEAQDGSTLLSPLNTAAAGISGARAWMAYANSFPELVAFSGAKRSR